MFCDDDPILTLSRINNSIALLTMGPKSITGGTLHWLLQIFESSPSRSLTLTYS